MKLTELIDYSIAPSAVPASTAGFSVPLLLVDAPEVPVDKRYRTVTRSTSATTLTTTTTAAAWAAILWGQNYNPAQAYIGRWASAATPSYFVCADVAAFSATWTAVTAGDFGLSIGGVPTALVTTGTMAGATSLADVATIIETAVQAEGGDWAACTVEIDDLGRLVLSNSDTGAAADSVSFIAPTGGAGTDITAASYLNIGSQAFAVAGLDAEDPDDAMAAILALDDTPFVIHEIGASIAQQTSLAVACAAYKKMYEINVRDSDAIDSGATTDIAYILSNATNNNAHGTYTEHATNYPSAAINGEIYMLPEGTGQLSNHALLQTNESGLNADGVTVEALTSDERSALDDKGCDYLIQPVSSVHLRHGLTFGGVEVRHRVGYYWAERRATEEIYAYLLLNNVTTFSDKHIQAIGAIIFKYIDILVTRECSESYTPNLPSAADISLVEKATHTLTLSEVAAIISQYAINDVVATATATV